MSQIENKPQISPVMVLAFGVIAISFSSIFIRWAQDEKVPSLVIATWRTLLAGLILLPLALTRRQQELRAMSVTDWGLALLSGGMLGLHFGSWISSLEFTSITSSTVLVATSPLWVGLASPFVLNEGLSRSLKVGIALAIAGSLVIGLGDVVVWQNGRFAFDFAVTAASNPLWGNFLALVGAWSAAVYLLVGRKLRQNMSLLTYTAVVYSAAGIALLGTTLFSGLSLFGYSPTVYLLFVMMTLFPQLIGHSSFNWALGFLPAAYVSVAVISEPIGATILGMLFFQEFPGWVGLIGSGLILAGIVRASRK